jgi:hypothetical protein
VGAGMSKQHRVDLHLIRPRVIPRWPPLLLHDVHTNLRCNIRDLDQVIDTPAALADWLGIHRDPSTRSVQVPSEHGEICFVDLDETWLPASRSLLASATAPSGPRIRGHFTARETIVSDPSGARPGVEVWVHLEMPSSTPATLTAVLLQAIKRGMQRLQAEFDTP